jgi:hypothetical protein
LNDQKQITGHARVTVDPMNPKRRFDNRAGETDDRDYTERNRHQRSWFEEDLAVFLWQNFEETPSDLVITGIRELARDFFEDLQAATHIPAVTAKDEPLYEC